MRRIMPHVVDRKGPSGSTVKFRHLTVEDGLPSNGVRAVLQDRQGFIWFATEDGLVRFDGHSLRVYRTEPGNPNSLGDRTVFAMLEDGQGYFWLGLSANLDRFDPCSETFVHYALPGTVAFRLCCDRQGAVWVGTLDQGLYRFDPSIETFTHYPHDPRTPASLSAHHVRCVMEDQAGTVWVVTEAGLDRLDRQGDKFFHYAPFDLQGTGCSRINYLYQDTNGRFWVGTEGGLCGFDPETGQFVAPVDLADSLVSMDGPVTCICEDKYGRLWVASAGQGLYCVDLESGQVTPFLPNPANLDSLIHDGLWSVYVDREGNIWAGTIGKGVDRLSALKFAHYSHDPTDPSSLSSSSVTSFCELDGAVWIGNGDLYRLDPVDVRLTRYVPGEHEPDFAAVCSDCEGSIWGGGGAAHGGLARFDPLTEQTTVYHHDADDVSSLSDDTVQVVYQDREGQLWIGTEKGLNWFDRTNERFVLCVPYPENPLSLDNSIHLIYQDQVGDLWLGGWRCGLIRAKVDRSTTPPVLSFVRYLADEHNPASISGRSVLSVLEDRAGRLWVGTASALDCFDRRTETFTHYTEVDGLPSSVVRGILEDDDGRLWISTMNGLSCFDVEAGTFRNYDAADGLQSNQFMHGACLKGSDGTLYFGGVNGVNGFDPGEIRDSPFVPPVVLTELLLFNRPVTVGSSILPQRGIWATDEITLGPEDYVFAFEFAALSYVAPSRNNYRYRLDGFDQDWNEVTSRRRFASYSNLPAGEYVFRVIGSNGDGVWNTEGVSLKITVSQPLWAKLQAEKEAAEAANQAKSQFLANISHELRTPLNAILGFAKLMARDETLTDQQRQNVGIIERSGEHLLALVNDVLDLSKVEAGKVELEPVVFDVHHLIHGLDEMFSLPARQKGLTVAFDLASGVPQYIRADAGKLRQVLINLLDNAVKFTMQGDIILRVTARPGYMEGMNQEGQILVLLHFEIQDTGVGISSNELERLFDAFVQTESGRRSGQGTGLGLPISREYVRLMGGELTVESREGEGATFGFDLPVKVIAAGQTHLAQPVQQTADVTPGQVSSDGGTFRLLVTDDEKGIAAQEPSQLDPALLHDVPQDWRSAMHRALVIGDVAEMSALIDELPGPQSLLDELRKRVYAFEHEGILRWIQGE